MLVSCLARAVGAVSPAEPLRSTDKVAGPTVVVSCCVVPCTPYAVTLLIP